MSIEEQTYNCVRKETLKALCKHKVVNINGINVCKSCAALFPKPKNQGYKKLVEQKKYFKILQEENIYLIQ
jgi:hypothetical protein